MTRAFPGMANTFDYPQPGAGTLTQRHGRLIGTQIRGVESACAVMRRIIRSRDGRPCRRRLLCTPLQVRRALVWQQDRWPVQLIPSTLWLGLEVIRVLVHVTTSKGGPSPSSQTTQYTYNRHKFGMAALE
jgi:hypothetical protein